MKSELRKKAKEIRKSLRIEVLSEKIKLNLFNSYFYKQSENILNYYSIGSEVYTLDYFSDTSKKWFIPKIQGENMSVCPYNKDKLRKNQYGICEASTKEITDLSIIDMIIIPALCCDRNGYRIGYGKGYYDRFLKGLTHNPYKVVLTYSDLLYDTVYPETFDVKCDYIVTENKIYTI